MARSHAPLTADASAGRFHKESVTLLAPDGQANVIISSEPLDPTLTTAQTATTQSRWFADREDVLRLTLLSAGIAQ